MNKRRDVADAVERLLRAIGALGLGDIDGEHRTNAIRSLMDVQKHVSAGFNHRESERQREDERRIIRLYRAGRLKECDEPRTCT